MSRKYLTINDRNKMEVLKSEGYSSRRTAKILGFCNSTIPRELKRCKGDYRAVGADTDNKYKSSFKGRKTKVDNSITKIISDIN